uniref:Uncharacterized protein n=1 Tax=Octopus bimaculoides TaxID=37653 RepID=A0A0L8GTA5_OCTBM
MKGCDHTGAHKLLSYVFHNFCNVCWFLSITQNLFRDINRDRSILALYKTVVIK